MIAPGRPEAASRRPAAGRRVVQLGARLHAGAVARQTADDEHAAVAKQGGGEVVAVGAHAPGRRPAVRRRVVQLGGRGVRAAAGDEHASVGEPDGDVQPARLVQRAAGEPSPRGRVVQLGAGLIDPADHEYAPVGEPRRGQVGARDRHTRRRRPGTLAFERST